MISYWMLGKCSFDFDSSSNVSRDQLREAVRDRYVYLVAASLITLGVLLQFEKLRWLASEDRAGLALSVLIGTLPILIRRVPSVLASKLIAMLLHVAVGVFFGRSLFVTSLWSDPAGSVFVDFILISSILIYAAITGLFFDSERAEKVTLVSVTLLASFFVLFFTTPTVLFEVEANTYVVEVYTIILVCVGLMLVRLDQHRWRLLCLSSPFNAVELELAVAIRAIGLLLLSVLLSLLILFFELWIL